MAQVQDLNKLPHSQLIEKSSKEKLSYFELLHEIRQEFLGPHIGRASAPTQQGGAMENGV